MRVATIGAGTMAEALSAGWVKAGHDLFIGGRSAKPAEALAARLGPRAKRHVG